MDSGPDRLWVCAARSLGHAVFQTSFSSSVKWDDHSIYLKWLLQDSSST